MVGAAAVEAEWGGRRRFADGGAVREDGLGVGLGVGRQRGGSDGAGGMGAVVRRAVEDLKSVGGSQGGRGGVLGEA